MTTITLHPPLPNYDQLTGFNADQEDNQLPIYTPRSLQTIALNDDYFQNHLEIVRSAGSSISTNPETDHVYDSKHLRLNLGPRIWGTEHPAYGRGSSIQGIITLKTTKSVERVAVFLDGIITTAVPTRNSKVKVTLCMFPVLRLSEVVYRDTDKNARPVSASGASTLSPPGTTHLPQSRMGSMLNLAALTSSVSLTERSRNKRSQCQGEVPTRVSFNLNLPSNGKLPPTFQEEYDEMSVKVVYKLRVEMHRKWKKPDCIEALISYLPKTCPDPYHHNLPPLPADYDWKNRCELDSIEWKVVRMTSPSILNQSDEPVAVTLHLAQPLSYKSGPFIPYRLFLESSTLPGSLIIDMFKEALSPNTTLENGPALSVALHKVLAITMSTKRLRKDIHIGEMGVVDKIQEGAWDESGRIFVPHSTPEAEGNRDHEEQPVQSPVGRSTADSEKRCLRITGQILAGKSECESIWSVLNVAEKQYALKFSLTLPSLDPSSAPPCTYTHNEIIGLTTHSREELATESGLEDPALGLIGIDTGRAT